MTVVDKQSDNSNLEEGKALEPKKNKITDLQFKFLLEKEQQKRKDQASYAMHLAMVKMAIGQPKKTHTVNVQLKSGGTYSYKYADLADVDKAIMNAIKKTAGDDGKPLLTYRFEIDNGAEGVQVETVIIDAVTGYQEKTNRVWFKNLNVGKAQETASLISYAKRYSLSGAFGIASEDDDDAQSQIMNQTTAIDKGGIKIIFDDYVNNHSQKAKNWIKGKHDEATGSYIKQLLGDYELNHRLAKNKENAINRRKKDQRVKEPAKKIKTKSEDEVIKNIVDKPKEDPFVDKKENYEPTEKQQSLFNDDLGGLND